MGAVLAALLRPAGFGPRAERRWQEGMQAGVREAGGGRPLRVRQLSILSRAGFTCVMTLPNGKNLPGLIMIYERQFRIS